MQMLQKARRIAFLVLAPLLVGCTDFSDWLSNNVNFNGAQQLAIQDESVRRVDLAQVIVDNSRTSDHGLETLFGADGCDSYSGKTPIDDGVPRKDRGRRCLEVATKIFNSDLVNQRDRRNQIQARLMAAARAECAVFTQHLNTIQSSANLVTGLTATGTGAAGAIVTDASSARLLAGLAAAATGARAEFNTDFFYKEAVPVLVAAIKSSQEEYFRDVIVGARQQEIGDYPLWDAIGDAFRFNDMCSLVSALHTLDRDTVIADSPGLDAVNRTLIKTNTMKKIIEGNVTDYDLVPSSSPGVRGAGGATGNVNSDPAYAYMAAVQILSVEPSRVKMSFQALRDRANSAGDTAIDKAQATVEQFSNAALNVLKQCEAKSLDIHRKVLAASANADPTSKDSQIDYVKAQTMAASTAQSLNSYSNAMIRLIDVAVSNPPAIPSDDTNIKDPELQAMAKTVADLLLVTTVNGNVQPNVNIPPPTCQ